MQYTHHLERTPPDRISSLSPVVLSGNCGRAQILCFRLTRAHILVFSVISQPPQWNLRRARSSPEILSRCSRCPFRISQSFKRGNCHKNHLSSSSLNSGGSLRPVNHVTASPKIATPDISNFRHRTRNSRTRPHNWRISTSIHQTLFGGNPVVVTIPLLILAAVVQARKILSLAIS